MHRITVGSALILLGLPLVLVSVFVDAAGSGTAEYSFGWEQKAGVAIGCGVIWLACVVLSGWGSDTTAGRKTTAAVEAALAKASDRTWFELSQTQTVRGLGAVQAVVILATALCLLAFTSAPWYVALLAGVALSIAVNIALGRRNRAALDRERQRRSR